MKRLAFFFLGVVPWILGSGTLVRAEERKIDFFDYSGRQGVEDSSWGRRGSEIDPQTCRTHIREVLCMGDPSDRDKPPAERVCHPGAETYAPALEQLFDSYPMVLQRMFCSLQFIFIEQDLDGTAYGGLTPDKKAMIGIQQSILDHPILLRRWATWKEQLSFGGKSDSYGYDPTLPLVLSRSPDGVNDLLYFVIAHEFGHIFDFANELNKFDGEGCDREKSPENCQFVQGSWGALSWADLKQPLRENDFPLREGLCFYWCGDHALSPATIPTVYQGLSQSNFISTYATLQAWDDFADSLAYFLMDRELGSTYRIMTHGGFTLDIMTKLHSEVFAKKFHFIEEFLNREEIVYP